ncbi:MAG: hypothetical protein PHO01_09295 [Desulfotomaculaceae bacterium]|nr:hypothetical protein [Desulfotomaculaceae bacterium]
MKDTLAILANPGCGKPAFGAGTVMSVTSFLTMILFIFIQISNGNPDAGMKFIQFYFPVIVFIGVTTIGILSTIKLAKAD